MSVPHPRVPRLACSHLFLRRNASDLDGASALRPANQRQVKGSKGCARWSAGQVQRISKLDSVDGKSKRCSDGFFIFGEDVFEAEQLCEGVSDSTLVKSVEAPQNPVGFEQYRFSDPDGLGFKEGPCGSGLLKV